MPLEGNIYNAMPFADAVGNQSLAIPYLAMLVDRIAHYGNVTDIIAVSNTREQICQSSFAFGSDWKTRRMLSPMSCLRIEMRTNWNNGVPGKVRACEEMGQDNRS